MLSDGKKEHPDFRPKYMHSVPLAEIIQLALKVEGINTKAVQGMWRDFVDRFETEIKVLIDIPEKELNEVDSKAAAKIIAFRKGWVHYIPGGGGEYGKPVICNSKEEFEKKGKELEEQRKHDSFENQKTLSEF